MLSKSAARFCTGQDGCVRGRERLSREELVKARVTVRLFLVLLEGSLVELLQTERTGKVLGMVLLEHGRDAATSDRATTASAQSASFVVVVRFAERLSLNVKVVGAIKGQLAVLQMKHVCYCGDVHRAVLSDWHIPCRRNNPGASDHPVQTHSCRLSDFHSRSI